MWILKHQQLHSGGFDIRPPGGWQLNRLIIHKPQPITTLQYYAIYCNSNILQYAIYHHTYSMILYCIVIENIAIYQYIYCCTPDGYYSIVTLF